MWYQTSVNPIRVENIGECDEYIMCFAFVSSVAGNTNCNIYNYKLIIL